jgi:hypothetical protein
LGGEGGVELSAVFGSRGALKIPLVGGGSR